MRGAFSFTLAASAAIAAGSREETALIEVTA